MGKPRQAVVIIHGIGKQRPMDTLRGFVSGVLTAAGGTTRKTFNKPDFNADASSCADTAASWGGRTATLSSSNANI